ncbi:MAG: hypothetical protein EA360_01735 [Balneolaceae bacterium]|nr:MAG: hypothetical protein EA360_01735 [Balneolaceae bacterium]
MSDKITFKELVERIAQETSQSHTSANSFISELVELIEMGLKSGQPVSISGFGKFELRWMNERKGTHPQTGEEITIPGQNKVVFKPFKALRETVNSPFAHLESELAAKKVKSLPREVKPTETKASGSDESIENLIFERAIPPHLLETREANENLTTEAEPETTGNQSSLSGAFLTDAGGRRSSYTDESSVNIVHEKSSFNWSMAAAGILVMLAFLLFFFVTQRSGEPDSAAPQESIAEAPALFNEPETAPATDLSPPVPPEIEAVSSGSGEITSDEIQIRSGDSLWVLAERELGNPVLWPAIYELNRNSIENPNQLPVNFSIQIPRFSDTENLTKQERELVAEGYFSLYHWNLRNSPQEARYFLWVAGIFSEDLLSKHADEVREEDLAFALNR